MATPLQSRAYGLYGRASYLDRNGREREACAYYERALKRGLDSETRAQALTFLGSSHYNLRNWQRSQVFFQRALRALHSLAQPPDCTVKGKPIVKFVQDRLKRLQVRAHN